MKKEDVIERLIDSIPDDIYGRIQQLLTDIDSLPLEQSLLTRWVLSGLLLQSIWAAKKGAEV